MFGASRPNLQCANRSGHDREDAVLGVTRWLSLSARALVDADPSMHPVGMVVAGRTHALAFALAFSGCAASVGASGADAATDGRDAPDGATAIADYVGVYRGVYENRIIAQDAGLHFVDSSGPGAYRIQADDGGAAVLELVEPVRPAAQLHPDGGTGDRCLLNTRAAGDRLSLVPGIRCRYLENVDFTVLSGEAALVGRALSLRLEYRFDNLPGNPPFFLHMEETFRGER